MVSLADLQNNPGNLMSSDWTKSQPGFVGVGKNNLAIFDSFGSGVSAQQTLLESYIGRGYDTPAEIANRYAPANAAGNSSASTNNYASYIAKQLGIGVNDTVSKSDVPALSNAMYQFEAGSSAQQDSSAFHVDPNTAKGLVRTGASMVLDYYTGGMFSAMGGSSLLGGGGSGGGSSGSSGGITGMIGTVVDNWQRITLVLIGLTILFLGIFALTVNSAFSVFDSAANSGVGKAVGRVAKVAAVL